MSDSAYIEEMLENNPGLRVCVWEREGTGRRTAVRIWRFVMVLFEKSITFKMRILSLTMLQFYNEEEEEEVNEKQGVSCSDREIEVTDRSINRLHGK